MGGTKRVRGRHTKEALWWLLGGCNDSDADAEALGDLLENRFAGRLMVNLIPYNPTPDLPYDRPTEGRARAFQVKIADWMSSAGGSGPSAAWWASARTSWLASIKDRPRRSTCSGLVNVGLRASAAAS